MFGSLQRKIRYQHVRYSEMDCIQLTYSLFNYVVKGILKAN